MVTIEDIAAGRTDEVASHLKRPLLLALVDELDLAGDRGDQLSQIDQPRCRRRPRLEEQPAFDLTDQKLPRSNRETR